MKVVEPFNPKAYQIADEGQLGAVQCEYRDDTHISWGYAALLLFLGILFLSITHLLLQPSSSASTGSGFDWFYTLIHNVQSLCFIQVSVLMFIGGLASIYQHCRDFVQGEKHIYICSQGEECLWRLAISPDFTLSKCVCNGRITEAHQTGARTRYAIDTIVAYTN